MRSFSADMIVVRSFSDVITVGPSFSDVITVEPSFSDDDMTVVRRSVSSKRLFAESAKKDLS